MLLWKLQKCQILPVNQNLSSVYFLLAKFQLVSFNLSNAMIWQNNDMHSQTAKTVFSHLNGLSSVESPIAQCGRAAGLVTIRSKVLLLLGLIAFFLLSC